MDKQRFTQVLEYNVPIKIQNPTLPLVNSINFSSYKLFAQTFSTYKCIIQNKQTLREIKIKFK